MKHRPDSRGLLYFWIAVLSVWAGELANLGGAELLPASMTVGQRSLFRLPSPAS